MLEWHSCQICYPLEIKLLLLLLLRGCAGSLESSLFAYVIRPFSHNIIIGPYVLMIDNVQTV